MPRKKADPSQATTGVLDDDDLAIMLRAVLPHKGLTEQKMFGGIGFMLNDNMIAGASKRGLLLRVGKERYSEALARTGASEMVMRGRPVEGYVRVDPEGLNEAALRSWVALAQAFVETLPPKAGKQKGRVRK